MCICFVLNCCLCTFLGAVFFGLHVVPKKSPKMTTKMTAAQPSMGGMWVASGCHFVLCVFRRVKDHHNLLHFSPRLKTTCVRQVVLDKWFPLKQADGMQNNPRSHARVRGVLRYKLTRTGRRCVRGGARSLTARQPIVSKRRQLHWLGSVVT